MERKWKEAKEEGKGREIKGRQKKVKGKGKEREFFFSSKLCLLPLLPRLWFF